VTDDGDPLSERQISGVIRQLSSEHAARVVERDRARAWRRIESSAQRAVAPPLAAGGGAARVAILVLAVAVAAGVLLALGFRADSQLSYELSGATVHAGVIEARRGEATVTLSDGSSILAENQSRFSVDVVGRNSALTRLVSGRLHVRVQHDANSSYRFIAGPYEVRVVGTEFDLGWDEQSGLSLSMAKGEVRLIEPGGKLRTVSAGQSLQLPGLERALSAPPARTAEAVKPAPEQMPERTRSPQPAATAASWDGLVAKGRFAEVVREAETLGVDAVLATRGPSDLKALGQAARYVGKRPLALRAFSALRDRNRGSESARNAAFFLARLHEEQGNQAEALRWLGFYVSESPRGVYAAEAYGRRLSLTERLRGRAAALPLAREYLERFPEGAYAPSARAIAHPSP
jgi:ferric-dicitrate binding protein FerR (iron transport regulator)